MLKQNKQVEEINTLQKDPADAAVHIAALKCFCKIYRKKTCDGSHFFTSFVVSILDY